MSARANFDRERWLELLVEQATAVRVDEADKADVQMAARAPGAAEELAALELTAARLATAYAMKESSVGLPGDLAARLRAQGVGFAAATGNESREASGPLSTPVRRAAAVQTAGGPDRAAQTGPTPTTIPSAAPTSPTRPSAEPMRVHTGETRGAGASGRRIGRAGWMMAAAALALAAVGWWPRVAGLMGNDAGPDNASVQLASLMRSAADVRRADWQRGEDEAAGATTGEIVWSPSRQEGYMVFRGLRANDPSREQYQLWIFDPERDERYPVHGGVFDMPKDCGELVIPIKPRLPVPKASTFVVTVEKPGGVWVSDRSRIAAIAKTGS